MKDNPSETTTSFVEAGKTPRISLMREVFIFLKENKKWWLLPIIVVFVLFGGLVIFGGSSAPFIYSLF